MVAGIPGQPTAISAHPKRVRGLHNLVEAAVDCCSALEFGPYIDCVFVNLGKAL